MQTQANIRMMEEFAEVGFILELDHSPQSSILKQIKATLHCC